VRAAVAYAALVGEASVRPEHVEAVLPLVFAHRAHDRAPERERTSAPPPPSQRAAQSENTGRPEDVSKTPEESQEQAAEQGQEQVLERIFAPTAIGTLAVRSVYQAGAPRGGHAPASSGSPGPVVGARRTESPGELDLRATLTHAVLATGEPRARIADLHERVRKPRTGTRYLLLIDSSGSHAARERMRFVKGAASSLLTHSFRNGDEIAIVTFRGTAAQVILEPTPMPADAYAALEYLPTGGRTPLAHALTLAREYLTPATILILLTDGHANVALAAGDPWQEALTAARQIQTSALVIDTEDSRELLGRPRQLAEALHAEYVSFAELEGGDMRVTFERLSSAGSRS